MNHFSKQNELFGDLAVEISQNSDLISELPSGGGDVQPTSISFGASTCLFSFVIGNTGYFCTVTRECMNSCTWTNC